MKQYLLVDCMGDYKEIMSQKELKSMVVDHIVEDTLENIGDEGIVRNNVLELEKMIFKEPTMKNIKDLLESFSYKTIDLLDLQRDLEDVKGYLLNKQDYVGDICETIDKINNEVNKCE